MRGSTALQAKSTTSHASASPDTGSMTLTTAQIRDLINSSIASAFTSMGINGLSSSSIALTAFHSSNSPLISVTPTSWFLDSGASNHMTSVVQNLHNHKPYHGHDSITTANGDQLPISGMGTITIGTLTLPNVYFVPNLAANLISIG